MSDNQSKDFDFYKISKSDVGIIAMVLLFSIISIAWTVYARGVPSSKGLRALIYQNNKLVEESGLDKNKIITLFDGKMQIEIKEKKIRVVKSDCPHHICVNRGWIQYSGQTIACVPHKVLIEIKSTASLPVLDAATY